MTQDTTPTSRGSHAGAVGMTNPVGASAPAPSSPRLVSLDTLRGFTMFWIMGGRELLLAIVACAYPAAYDAVETHVTHPRWEGFVVWDLIMPTFLFLVGASMPFAMAKWRKPGTMWTSIYARIFRRVILLWILGMIAQGSLQKYELRSLELFSNTLQAIAVGYLFASIALLHLPILGQIAVGSSCVVGYWVLLKFVPFAGHAAGTLQRKVNFPRYVDELILRGFRRDHDYTWIVTSLSFVATVLMGVMAGHVLRSSQSATRKVLLLSGIGVVCMAAGWGWSYSMPLNRHLWTPSMVLWSGGVSFLIVAVSYLVIDVAGFVWWTFPFVVIGANSLLAYVWDHVFDRSLSDILIANLARQYSEPVQELIRAIGEVTVMWLLLYYMYRNRSFLRA